MNNRYYQSSSSITYIDDNNQIQLAANSINDNNKKQFNAKYKKINPEGTLEKNFNNEEQFNQFLGNHFLSNKYIVDNSRVKKKKVKKSKKSTKKRRSRRKIF